MKFYHGIILPYIGSCFILIVNRKLIRKFLGRVLGEERILGRRIAEGHVSLILN